MPESADDQSERVLSILTPAEIGALGGLQREAIVGVFRDEALSLDRFRSNPGFLRYLHDVIRIAGPSDPQLTESAARQVKGWIYTIDLRTLNGPMGDVPPEDIIGAFEVANGPHVVALDSRVS